MKRCQYILTMLFMLGAVLSVAGASGQALPADTLTMEEAVAIALESHAGLAAERERLNELEAQVREAWAAALPSVDATASGVRSQNPGFLNSPNFEEFADGFDPAFLQPVPVTLYDYAVRMEQMVYAFGKVSKGIQAARIEQDRAALEIRNRELEIARLAASAFYELARADARISVLQSERGSREKQVTQARDYLEVGTGTRLQYLQAKAALASLKSREIAARGEREIAALELNRSIGRDPADPVRIDGAVLSAADLEDLPDSASLLGDAYARADLQALEKEREVLDRINAIRADRRLPELSLRIELAGVARAHSRDMAEHNFFDHANPSGSRPAGRVRAAGVRFKGVAENITMNNNPETPADQAVRDWMDSPGHRRNILDAAFLETGVGMAVSKDGRYYFTQLFLIP